MEFQQKRRQQFLGESAYAKALAFYERSEKELLQNLNENREYPDSVMRVSRTIAFDKFFRLVLRYTGGAAISELRQELEGVVAAYEAHGDALWTATADRNESVFDFDFLDDYCALMQLVGLCYLLHRRDLLPRIAAMQDGIDGANGGSDVIYEEFMIHVFGMEQRYQTEHASQVRPYEHLFYALTEDTSEKQLKELGLFLKRWYKDLVGTGWHDSHKPDEAGEQGGYCGYWSFEAGAAVLLLGIDDDSSLHQYLYYPKDLVAWAREHQRLRGDTSGGGKAAALRLRCEAGEPCPREGWWFTPAKADSRRHFMQGEVMPAFTTDYGATVWQWDELQKG